MLFNFGDANTEQPQAAVTPEYPTSPNPNDPLEGIALKDKFKVSDLAWGIANQVYDKSESAFTTNDLIIRAAKGEPPQDRLVNLEEERKAKQLERQQLKMREADPTGYLAAIDTLQKAMMNQPQQPGLVRPQLNERDQIMGALAVVLGGVGVAPDAIQGLLAGATNRADFENKQNQAQFANDVNNYNQRLKVLDSNVDTAATMYQKDADRAMREYEQADRSLGSQIDDIRGEQQRVQSAINNYERNAQDFFESMGGSIDENTYRNAIQSAQNLEQTQGLPQGSLTSILNAKYQTGATLKAKQFEAQKEQFKKMLEEKIRQFGKTHSLRVDHEKAWVKWLQIQQAMNDRKMDLQEANAAFDQWLRTQQLANDTRALDIKESGAGKAVPESTTQKKYNDLENQVSGLDAEIAGLKEEARATTDPEEKAKLVAKLRGKEGGRKSVYDLWMKTAAQLNNEKRMDSRPPSKTGTAATRNNNPLAMWGGSVAKKFGATGSEKLRDGLNQGNNAATFPTPVHGAAAAVALIKSSGYAGKTIAQAISKWSGGNDVASYLQMLRRYGVDTSAVITPAFIDSPQGTQLLKAMAHHENGKPFKLSDSGWEQAKEMAKSGSAKPPVKQPTKPAKQAQPQAPKTSTGNKFTPRGK